ncbi:MAG: hypothetical protein IJY61_08005 [Candidatus Gastranaerophilales bacterium]|nr:hypothetical protein [Candidatus Gastranaerophilales bacterium]
MGLDLSSYEAFKKQAQSSVSGNSSTGSSSGTTSSNPISGGSGATQTYSEVSLFTKQKEEEEKKASNAYEELFDEVMYGKTTEEEAKDEVKNSDYQKELDSKYKDDDNKSAKEAFSDLTKAGILNEKYYDRMICATEKLVQNTDWMISMADENGNISDVALADAVAASFDSELDLYIQDIVAEVMAEYGTCSKGYTSEKARAALAAKGIRIDSVGAGDEENGSNTNRVYSFSLVELPENFDSMSPAEQMEYVYSDDAKIVEDAAGNKGSYLFADALIPDGFAQNAEIEMSSILDSMGYDCISKADFIGSDGKFDESEYNAMLSEVGEMVNSGELKGSDKISDIYGNTREICDSIKRLWGGDGSAPGQNGIGGGSSDGVTDAAKELAEEKEMNDKYEQILDAKKADYKEEHGEEATGDALAKLESEAKIEAKNQL